jgi:hypothetical protein
LIGESKVLGPEGGDPRYRACSGFVEITIHFIDIRMKFKILDSNMVLMVIDKFSMMINHTAQEWNCRHVTFKDF